MIILAEKPWRLTRRRLAPPGVLFYLFLRTAVGLFCDRDSGIQAVFAASTGDQPEPSLMPPGSPHTTNPFFSVPQGCSRFHLSGHWRKPWGWSWRWRTMGAGASSGNHPSHRCLTAPPPLRLSCKRRLMVSTHVEVVTPPCLMKLWCSWVHPSLSTIVLCQVAVAFKAAWRALSSNGEREAGQGRLHPHSGRWPCKARLRHGACQVRTCS
jgi:hypothetical protein